MKTIAHFIIVTALLVVSTSAPAKSWRINNNLTADPDFTSINAAMSSTNVQAGDTLYLDPGCSLSGDQTVNKQVTIVGPGYFRADTPHAFSYLQNTLYIRAAYTKVEGIIMSNADIIIYAQHVTIERCKLRDVRVGGYYDDARYATIRQCYGNQIYGQGWTSNNCAYCTIENCILRRDGTCIYDFYIPTIRQNYIMTSNSSHVLSSLESASITDNVIINTANSNYIFNYIANPVNISNNVISGNENANYPVNKYGNTEAAVFKLEGLNDQRYQLKDDSPAKGYATDGGDCGPFGGLYPYVLGGLPNGYPYYTKAIIAPKSVNGKVNVSLNIKMQND